MNVDYARIYQRKYVTHTFSKYGTLLKNMFFFYQLLLQLKHKWLRNTTALGITSVREVSFSAMDYRLLVVLLFLLFLWVLRKDCVILLWQSLSLPYNY